MRGRPALVFAGAPLTPTPRLQQRLATHTDPYVVAADGGAATALAFGFTPDLVVGDLDSLAPDALADLRARGIPIAAYPRDKEAIDGQLAVEHALRIDPSALLLLGFLGGARLDQSAAGLLMLAALPAFTRLLDASNEVRLLRDAEIASWATEPGEIVSLLPLTDEARGVWTDGLRWPLADATLRLGDTRGVSNEPLESSGAVTVRLGAGRLLLVRHFPERPL